MLNKSFFISCNIAAICSAVIFLKGVNTVNDKMKYPVNLTEVIRAKKFAYEYLQPTQLIPYKGLSALLCADIYVKHENHNPTGSF